MLLRPYGGRKRGRACATCGLSDLSICEHKHFTALCPPPLQEAATLQQLRAIIAVSGLAVLPCLPCLLTERSHARGPLREGEGSEANSWSAGITCVCRRSSSSRRAEHSTAEHSGAWGAKRSRGRARERRLSVAAPACLLAFHHRRWLPSGVVVRHSSSCCPSAPTYLSIHPPSRLASNATHLQPRPHPRLHLPRCSSARSQRPLRALLLCTAPPSPPPCARLQLSSTRVRRRRQQREAQTVCVCPRASSYLALAATAPGRVQRHWRVN